MTKIDTKTFDKNKIYKFYPREKIEFECENCGKHDIRNAASLQNKENFYCYNCSMSFGSKGQNKKKKFEENKWIYSQNDLPERLGRQRDTLVKFYCEDCGKETNIKAGFTKRCEKLLCHKCYKKFKSQKRWGVDNPLQIFNKLGIEITHTKEGIEKTRKGIIRHLWVDNWEDRKETIQLYNWKINKVNFDTMELQVESTCCHTIKNLIMGDDGPPHRWRCNCAKLGHSSIEEIQFLEILKQLYPNKKIINGYRGWTIDPNVQKNSYEIDIFFPDNNFGIEFNGTYWHDKIEQKREKLKIKRAADVGIKLINIWEDDWRHNKADCIKYIQGELNESNNS